MEKKFRSGDSKDFTQKIHKNSRSNNFLGSITDLTEVTIYEVIPSTKAKREMGQYYRMEKTFYYK
jgi:hypothetical protein